MGYKLPSKSGRKAGREKPPANAQFPDTTVEENSHDPRNFASERDCLNIDHRAFLSRDNEVGRSKRPRWL